MLPAKESAHLMAVWIDELRDAMAANYEDVRSAFAQLRDGDLSRRTESGRPVSRLVTEIVMAPRRDARTASRLDNGKAATPSPIGRALDAMSSWRTGRALSHATRGDVLAAWENAFNGLFSFVNDLTAEPLDASATLPRANVEAACAYLRGRLDRWPAWAAELRAATGAGPTR